VAEADQDKPRNRGLPSIQQARDARAEGRTRWPSPKFWAYVGLVMVLSAILHWKWTDSEVEHTKQKLLANQRGVAAELAPRWDPLRQKIEGWVTGLAHDPGPEVVDKETLAKWDFRTRPGIYVRLRVEEAQKPEDVRAGARNSLRDGFTAELMQIPNPNPTRGKECKRTHECPAGELCNEKDHCERPSQPLNLRVAYRTMHVLSEEWIREVQAADSDQRTNLFVMNFEDAVRDDIPLAVAFLTQAQYLLVVLDETPPGMPPAGDAGTMEGAVQELSHFARVAVFRLVDDKVLLRVRREPEGRLLGAMPAVSEESLAALRRQATSVGLAMAVRKAMGDNNAAVAPPE
jgi:hypothetical protein